MKELILDFSKKEFSLPTPENAWQQEIIDFIQVYLNNTQIPVQTSGSTGKPKKFFLPKKAMQQSAELTADFLDLNKGNSALLCLPVSYIAGKMMIVRAIEIGMKLICIEPKLNIVYQGEVDFCAMTPMQVETSENVFSSALKMRKLILGGAKVSNSLEESLKNIPSEIYETYGMTETITHIAMRKLNEQDSFHKLKGVFLSQNNNHCLVIKTPYFEEEIITNDVVELTSANSFRILGRIDNIINSGGLKINPEEIEEKLKPFISVPFIVHFKSDKTLEQKLVLVIESKKKIDINYPSNILQKNKQPKEIIFISEFPRTESGKIQRKEINLKL